MAKMSATDRKQFFLSRFEDQRHLLRTAIAGMAAGDLTQALHVATSIRVLVHETGGSKPLLKQLQSNYLELPILDRSRERQQPGAVTFYCPVGLKVSTEGIFLSTDLDSGGYIRSSLGTWWEASCMLLPSIGLVYRKELILGLANKEGGAHVDADLPRRYQELLGSKFFTVRMNDTNLGPVNLSRMIAGRSGVELLDCLDKNFPLPSSGSAL